MIIVKLMGGLGNQMFQYATGLALARKHNVPFRADLNFLLDRRKRYYEFTQRKYALDIFAEPPEAADDREIKRFLYPRHGNRYVYHALKRLYGEKNVYREDDVRTVPDFFSLPSEAYLDGYWQNPGYFSSIAEELRVRFAPANGLPASHQELWRRIKGSASVCLHVRKGDYVGHPELDVLDPDYYYRAIERLSEKVSEPRFFVFSDDIGWCRENLRTDAARTVFVDTFPGEKAEYDFRLMSECRHFIIGNSTFSWWGAWLGNDPRKIVIAPKRWSRSQEEEVSSTLEKDWTAL